MLINVVFMGGGTGTRPTTKVVSQEELGRKVQQLKDNGIEALRRDIWNRGDEAIDDLLRTRDPEGNSPLHGLVISGGTEFQLAVLSDEQLRNDRNHAGKTVLEIAYQYGNDRIRRTAEKINPSLCLLVRRKSAGGEAGQDVISHRDGYIVISERLDEATGMKYDVTPVKGSILPSGASGKSE